MGREAHAAEEPRPSQRDRCLATPAPGAPEHCLPDIFLLILLCDGDVPAIGFQFVLKNPPESVVLHAERVIEHGGDVVLSAGEHRQGSTGRGQGGLKRRVMGATLLGPPETWHPSLRADRREA